MYRCRPQTLQNGGMTAAAADLQRQPRHAEVDSVYPEQRGPELWRLFLSYGLINTQPFVSLGGCCGSRCTTSGTGAGSTHHRRLEPCCERLQSQRLRARANTANTVVHGHLALGQSLDGYRLRDGSGQTVLISYVSNQGNLCIFYELRLNQRCYVYFRVPPKPRGLKAARGPQTTKQPDKIRRTVPLTIPIPSFS